MSWKCSVIGHKLSKWLADDEKEIQERWCERCAWVQRVSTKLFDCNVERHEWSKWINVEYFYQRRNCTKCNKIEERKIVTSKYAHLTN